MASLLLRFGRKRCREAQGTANSNQPCGYLSIGNPLIRSEPYNHFVLTANGGTYHEPRCGTSCPATSYSGSSQPHNVPVGTLSVSICRYSLPLVTAAI